jgi:hypothetical protein
MAESKDPADPPRDPTANVPAQGLDGALDALQGILERRHVVVTTQRPPIEPPLADPDDLPVLRDVVVPGLPLQELQSAGPSTAGVTAPPCEDLVRRLVSELNVIIEGCIDEALGRTRQDLMVRLTNHLQIVLPEILQELTQRRKEG